MDVDYAGAPSTPLKLSIIPVHIDRILNLKMNLYWVVLIIILCLDIFLICKCLNLSGQLITLVSSDYPDIWEQFGRPLPGFISPNPFKARRLERFMMTKGLNTHKLNEKVRLYPGFPTPI